MAKIIFVLEDGEEVEVALLERLTIGRNEDNDVVVDDERLSPLHAELMCNADGSIQIFDRDSASGTFVNDVRVSSHTLCHGDRIAFGPLSGKLDLEEKAAASTPPQTQDNAATALHEAEQRRLKSEIESLEKELRDWQQRAEKERAMHSARVASLLEETQRLESAKSALAEAETAHREWLAAIETLSAQHADKTAAVERLNAQHVARATDLKRLSDEVETRQSELTAVEARLQQVRDECEQDESLLNSLRKQIIELEARLTEGRDQVATREEQVKTAEKRIAQLEQLAQHLEGVEKRVEELTGSEEKLAAAASLFEETDARHTTLRASCVELEQHHARLEKDIRELEELRKQHHQAAANAETEVKTIRVDVEAEAQRLKEARALRAGIEQECQELANTTQKLADARQRLAAVEQRLRDARNASAITLPHLVAPEKNGSGHSQEHLNELDTQIVAARKELASLEARIRESKASLDSRSTPEEASTLPQPVIVQVDAIRLPPVRMKSESTRTQVPGKS